jgi:hypothetical protein
MTPSQQPERDDRHGHALIDRPACSVVACQPVPRGQPPEQDAEQDTKRHATKHSAET